MLVKIKQIFKVMNIKSTLVILFVSNIVFNMILILGCTIRDSEILVNVQEEHANFGIIQMIKKVFRRIYRSKHADYKLSAVRI